MHLARRTAITAALAGSLLTGGAVGATVFGAAASSAANTSSTSTATTPADPANGQGPPAGYGPGAGPNGTFKPIETQSHESAESSQREAQETAGKVPTVP